MRTNGFALFRGEGAADSAKQAIEKVERYSAGVVVDGDGGWEEASGARIAGRRRVVVAWSLGESGGLPLVHGFVDGEPGPRPLPLGEFSILGRRKGGFWAARDRMGTRGLWVGKGAMASDHRMVGGTPRLVPEGATLGARGVVRTGKRERKGKVPSFGEASKELASLVDAAVKVRVQGRRVAVSFSGGLDSSLMALVASKHAEVVLCSAFVKGSLDERQTARAAELLGLELEVETVDEGLARAVPELPGGKATLMDRALWCIYTATSGLANRRGAGMIILGQLADELFGGYRKYTVLARQDGIRAAEAAMARDVKGCADWGFIRDEGACSRWAEARFPFADSRVASFAAGLPFEYKVRGDERKAVLRAAAIELGLPEELAMAPKKAAQFSSGAAKLIGRLTGF